MPAEGAPAARGRPTLSVVMPVFDGMAFLPRSLPPLAAQLGGELLELIVVDDGSRDASRSHAQSAGARVLETGGRLGPAAARNLGARSASGDAVLFVDADVVVHPDAVARVRDALAASDVVAVFGSYDDAPPEPGFPSRYMNLRHHFVHHAGAGEASTFWAGLGAVRRAAFVAAGGFDAARYTRPAIEDIELGYRLRDAGGRIELRPEILGTHLKRWTWRGLLETDVRCRAMPWSRLLAARPAAAADLNVAPAERGRAVLAAALASTLVAALLGRAPVWLPLVAFALAVRANRALFQFFARHEGVPFALAALLYHQLYYLYSAGCFVLAKLERLIGASPAGSDAPSVGGGGRR